MGAVSRVPANTNLSGACAAGVARLGVETCLAGDLMPLPRRGGVTPVAVAELSPDLSPDLARRLAEKIGPVALFVAPRGAIRARLLELSRDAGARRAENRVDRRLSCRPLGSAHPRLVPAVAALLLLAVVLWPGPAFATAIWIALLALTTNVMTMLAGLGASFLRARPATPATGAALPVVSLLVPVFRETAMLGPMLARLAALDYPADRLDLLLIVEAGDSGLRQKLAGMTTGPAFRTIVVPTGGVQTKPRALNYALSFARGSIVGIYDAEDHPNPDQLRRVAAEFAQAPDDVACLQGRLSFYNARQNWVSRAFALDYALWFGLVLPALARARLPVPLGGTTIFLRRDLLERLGGWDAHNVTEDADLGIRLARAGYRCRLIETETLEEAACQPVAWVRQRSRWLKGYAATWHVHSRRPGQLLRDLGPAGFVWCQFLLLGALAGFALAPGLWLLWFTTPLGAAGLWPAGAPPASVTGPALAVAAAIQVAAAGRAAWLTGQGWLWRSIPLLWPYFALGSLAFAKAIAELGVAPFYWDKTEHGLSPASYSAAS